MALSLPVRVLAFLVGTVIGLAVLAVAVAPGGFMGAWSILTLPAELRDASLVVRSGDGKASVYVPGRFWFPSAAVAKGTPASFTKEGEALLSVRTTESGSALIENGTERVRSEGLLAAPAQSPYSGIVAYAERTHADAEQGGPPQLTLANPTEWEVNLLLPGTDEKKRVASGYAPLFFDDTHFFFIAQSGIYRYDLATGQSVRVLERAFPFVIDPILQSPDRTLIAFRDPVEEATYVYRVHESGLLLMRHIPELLNSPALSNDALYDLRGTTEGGEVWKHELKAGEPQLIFVFSKQVPINRIVF